MKQDRFKALALGLFLLGLSPELWAQAEGEPNCHYVMRTETDIQVRDARNAWVTEDKAYKKSHPEPIIIGKPARAAAHLVLIDGCRPQCVSRVFCYSDHPELKDKLKGEPATEVQMSRGGFDVSCDPNPDSTPENPSCPLADECIASARKDKDNRVGKPAKAASGPLNFKSQAGEGPISFGLDPANPSTYLPKFTIPGETEGKSCGVCVSTFRYLETGNGFMGCSALPSGECKGAAACAAEANQSKLGNSRALDGRHIRHYVAGAPKSSGGGEAKDAGSR